MGIDERVHNFLLQTSEYCEYFRIGLDNNYYTTKAFNREIPLCNWDKEHLTEVLDELEGSPVSYRTLVNIRTIRKELKLL